MRTLFKKSVTLNKIWHILRTIFNVHIDKHYQYVASTKYSPLGRRHVYICLTQLLIFFKQVKLLCAKKKLLNFKQRKKDE